MACSLFGPPTGLYVAGRQVEGHLRRTANCQPCEYRRQRQHCPAVLRQPGRADWSGSPTVMSGATHAQVTAPYALWQPGQAAAAARQDERTVAHAAIAACPLEPPSRFTAHADERTLRVRIFKHLPLY